MVRRASHLLTILLVAVLLLPAYPARAQEPRPHSAKKAGIYSACLPGLGQVYNKKWWKVPIVYAGLGGIGYMAYSNHSDYKLFLTAYKLKTGNLDVGDVPSEYAIQLTEYYQASQLQAYKDAYRRGFELWCIILAAWYGLNIVDAVVDGHLYTYDISDDLSLAVDPVFTLLETPGITMHGTHQTGLALTLNF